MTISDLKAIKAPFEIVSKHDGRSAVIDGFARNYNVGLPVATFEGGGWCLISDLMKHWEIAPNQG